MGRTQIQKGTNNSNTTSTYYIVLESDLAPHDDQTSDRSDLDRTSSDVDSQNSSIFRVTDLYQKPASTRKSLAHGIQDWPTSGGTRVQPNEVVASMMGREKVEDGI